MTPQDFAYLASLIHNRSGIVLPAEKAYLLENRLRPLSGEFSFGSMADLVSALKLNRDERLARRVVEVMTTNETLFFRDTKPFDLLRDVVLPQLIEARAKGRPLRIWSAACSAGQEPYSIAMTIKENAARFGAWPIEILATDLSSTVLAKARSRSTRSSRCSGACRSDFSSGISPRTRRSGRSTPKFEQWSSSASTTYWKMCRV